MKNFSIVNGVARGLRHTTVIAGALVLALLLSGPPTHAEDEELSAETKACLKCHDKKGQVKKLENQETLSLYVSTKAFMESMHKNTDCEDCHADIDAKSHGKIKTPIKSKREHAIGMQESCRECHKKNFAKYEDSLHAALVKEGSKEGRKDAPLCSDCHSSHTLRSVKILGPIASTPCANCHEDIFKSYARDVHGLERVAKGKTAPICADCHRTHDVKAASLGDDIKDACLSCHKDAVAQHKDWLPNSARHFEAISCPVCHAPNTQRRVNLRLYDSVARRQVQEKTGVPVFETMTNAADLKNAGLDERALWSLLKEFNQDNGPGRTVLRGRLEVRSGVEAHQMSEKSKAIKDCDVCHQPGAEPFQSVTLTIAAPDGRPLRHGVQKDVLNSLQAMESVRGFYAIGSTRIKLLDTLLVLVLLAGIGGPLAHMTIKRLFKKFRAKQERDRASELVQAHTQAATGGRRAGDVAST